MAQASSDTTTYDDDICFSLLAQLRHEVVVDRGLGVTSQPSSHNDNSYSPLADPALDHTLEASLQYINIGH